MYLPGVPAHIMQRGNNRAACFFSENDFSYCREVLAEAMKRYGAELHAYCLMTNHVHLLMTPDAEDSISRIIQHLGRQYVQHIIRHIAVRVLCGRAVIKEVLWMQSDIC